MLNVITLICMMLATVVLTDETAYVSFEENANSIEKRKEPIDEGSELTCDELEALLVAPSEIKLKELIVLRELPEQYARRDQSHGYCFEYLAKLLVKIDYFKQLIQHKQQMKRTYNRFPAKTYLNNFKY